MKRELFFLKEDGDELLAPIFEPLLKTLHPAFKKSADEIEIKYSRSNFKHIWATYSKKGKSFPLEIQANFHAGDIFARLKIIAGMSIVAEGRQTGNVAMRFKGHDADVFVEIMTKETEEIIHFKCGAR